MHQPLWLLYALGCIWSAHGVSSGRGAAASRSVISPHAEQPMLLARPDTAIVIEFAQPWLRFMQTLQRAEIAAMVWPRRRSPPGGLLSSTPRHSMQQPPGPNHLPPSKIHIRKLEEKSFCHFLSCCRMPKWLRVKAPLFERYTTMNITRCLRGFSEASFWKICNSPQ